MQKNERLIERVIAVTAMVSLIGGCLYILAPFFAPLLWAAIISFCTWPIYTRLISLFRGQRIVPAVVMVLLALLCGVGPLAVAMFGLAQQTDEVRAIATKLIERGVPLAPVLLRACRHGAVAELASVQWAHDPKIDDPALMLALKADCFYVGALGSKK